MKIDRHNKKVAKDVEETQKENEKPHEVAAPEVAIPEVTASASASIVPI